MGIVIEPGAIDKLHRHVPSAHAYAIITDSNVRPLYAQRVAQQLPNSAIFEFPAGEQYKTRDTWVRLTDELLARGLGRDTCVVALGGGVTTDLGGFVAATFMRGVPVVQVPTSLLAMIDAAIGGKTGVDVPAGKNLVGAFHDPASVIIDATVLQTLPDSELSNGLAEAVKHGAIADAHYLDWIISAGSELFARRVQMLDRLIRRSIEIKVACVRADPREHGQRAALNFGHTIGHALERMTGYAIPHGHAVALGMLAEVEIGRGLGVTRADTGERIRYALRSARLPYEPRFSDVEQLLAATATDKKRRAGQTRCVLLAEAGRVARTSQGDWTWVVPDDAIREALRAFSV